MEKKIRTVEEKDYNEDVIKWERTVDIVRWEHDWENHKYTITYKE